MHVDNKVQWNTLVKHPEGILVIAGVTCPTYKNAVRGRSSLYTTTQVARNQAKKKEKKRSVPESQSIKKYIQRPSVFLAKEKPIFSIMSV